MTDEKSRSVLDPHIHERVNHFSFLLNRRFQRWHQSENRMIEYTKEDAELDEGVNDLLRSMDWLFNLNRGVSAHGRMR